MQKPVNSQGPIWTPQVSTGVYGSNSELIREALRGWMEREQRLLALDTAIARGMADSETGRVEELATVRAELRKQFAS
ncbi:MAG: type II toxin-antitoxin system ParD family antitoxin [Magnetococcales bacterium]|nr:type II toxin-antitoxin system ParD family antitoxin [Magnetococcales bacterium]